MDSRWIGFFLFVWLVGGLLMGPTYDGLNNAAEWSTGGSTAGNSTAIMSTLSSGSVASQTNPIIGTVSFLAPITGWISGFVNTVLWNFSFVQPYPVVARIFNIFGVIGLAMLFKMLYSSVTGNVTW